MNDHTALRQQLSDQPLSVLSCLPMLGRVMIVTRDGAATHERIGNVDKIEKKDDRFFCISPSHDFSVDLRSIASIVLDRSGRMNTKVLPKIEFHDSNGQTLFSVVALDGLEKFDMALMQFAGSPVPEAVKEPSEPATVTDDDIGSVPFNNARIAEAEITIELQRAGLVQRWRGVVPEINPAMGFINIITPDFHLHLRGGAVSNWQRKDSGSSVELTALDGNDRAMGLVLRGSADAFGNA